MKIIEEQLLQAMRDTPEETDCSVSCDLLSSLQLTTTELQETWLRKHRAPRDGRDWHKVEGSWLYAVQVETRREPVSQPIRTGISIRGTGSTLRPIVVSPVAPLMRRLPAKPSS